MRAIINPVSFLFHFKDFSFTSLHIYTIVYSYRHFNKHNFKVINNV